MAPVVRNHGDATASSCCYGGGIGLPSQARLHLEEGVNRCDLLSASVPAAFAGCCHAWKPAGSGREQPGSQSRLRITSAARGRFPGLNQLCPRPCSTSGDCSPAVCGSLRRLGPGCDRSSVRAHCVAHKQRQRAARLREPR